MEKHKKVFKMGQGTLCTRPFANSHLTMQIRTSETHSHRSPATAAKGTIPTFYEAGRRIARATVDLVYPPQCGLLWR